MRISDWSSDVCSSDLFWITTSGNYSTSALKQVIEELGADRVMFSVDWPFEDPAQAGEWMDTAPISEVDRQKVGRDNANRLFRQIGRASCRERVCKYV